MKTERLIVFVLAIFLFPCVSIADTVHIYGLTKNASDANLLKSIKSKLEAVKPKHTVTSSYDVLTVKKFTEIKADWIIFIGHGLSCTGEISRYASGAGLTKPTDLKWKAKGILLYACSVVDIGDFGHHYPGDEEPQYSCDESITSSNNYLLNGNFCDKYYTYQERKTDFPKCVKNRELPVPGVNREFPDPGLVWKKMADDNGIKYILGFSSSAPLIAAGGSSVLTDFIDQWISLGFKEEKNFLLAWKKISTPDYRERSYIRKKDDEKYYYSIGVDDEWAKVCKDSKDKKCNINKLNEYAGYKSSVWTDSEGKMKDDILIDEYERCDFGAKTILSRITDKNARELCLIGAIPGGVFKIDDGINFLQFSEILSKAVGWNSDFKPIKFKDFTCNKIDDNSGYCKYISYMKTHNVLEGTNEEEILPDKGRTLSDIYRFTISSFFKKPSEKKCETGRANCHEEEAAKYCGIALNKNMDSVATKEDVVIIVNRARKLKNAGGVNCYQ